MKKEIHSKFEAIESSALSLVGTVACLCPQTNNTDACTLAGGNIVLTLSLPANGHAAYIPRSIVLRDSLMTQHHGCPEDNPKSQDRVMNRIEYNFKCRMPQTRLSPYRLPHQKSSNQLFNIYIYYDKCLSEFSLF